MRWILGALLAVLVGCDAARSSDPIDRQLTDAASALRSGDLDVAEAQVSLRGGVEPDALPLCWLDRLCAACCSSGPGGAHCCVVCEGDDGTFHCG